MRKPLQNKVALVTGAGSGIGRAIALTLAQSGAQVILSDLSEASASDAVAETSGAFIAADLSNRASTKALCEQALQRFERVDILVNNAGFQHVCELENFPEEKWDAILSVLLTAPFLLTKHFWAGMKKQGWGRVINVASVHGEVASPFKAAYVSAKHGLLGFTKTAALEGGAHGITVNAICPAYVRTPLVEKQIAAQARTLGIGEDEVIQKVMLEPAAIKRLIEPREVADLALYLCSDSASAVTGSHWDIDLGWTAR